MNKPQITASILETTIVGMRSKLTESRNDEKAALIKMVKQAEATIQTLREEMRAREAQRAVDQQIFCDTLTVEFSRYGDFSESYTREYKAAVIDGETLKTIIFAERQLQNMGGELLFARVTIVDNDPETDI